MRWYWIGIGIAGVGIAAFTWWVADRPVSVVSVIAGAAPFVETIEAPGYLAASRHAAMGTKTAMRIATVAVEPGDAVAEGDLLIGFEASSLEARQDAAQASLEAAAADVAVAGSRLRSAKSALENAQATVERQRKLFVGQTISQAQLDSAEQALRQARGDAEAAQASLERAEATQRSANASLADARAGIAETRLVAPLAGIVLAVYADVGDVASAGTPLVELADPGSLGVEVHLDELALAQLSLGQPATIRLRSTPLEALTGHVASIDRRLDPDSREGEAFIRLDTPPAQWTLDQRTDVAVAVRHLPAALTVPAEWVLWERGRPLVLVDDNGRAARRFVTLGGTGAGRVEVLDGVVAGERLVFAPKLRPGRRITTAASGAP